MAQTQGNCFICGKTAGKTAIKNHILKEHNGGGESCCLIKAEGAYNKDYWLYFSVPADARLSAVDGFLRNIWCECCGHLSAFRLGGGEFGKSRKLSSLCAGNTLLYEYDFGSTTEILVTVVDEISRPAQREKARLLARNVPPPEECVKCGAPATQINALEGEALCDKCAESVEDDAALLPVVNSPRYGECAYDGELDKWTFDPSGPFPQPSEAPAKRRRGMFRSAG
ncbi:MAG: plasmid pRiA4b ORF-3 family protein [Synergistaceae bacterium]|nr:plasmid pRiA4b ORF-3 family protein [Synergistaceae bacterium]